MPYIWLTKRTIDLIKPLGKVDNVVREAVMTMIEEGADDVVDYPGPAPTSSARVSGDTWYLVNRMKTEFEYRTVDELVFDAVVNLYVKKGMPAECVEKLVKVVDSKY